MFGKQPHLSFFRSLWHTKNKWPKINQIFWKQNLKNFQLQKLPILWFFWISETKKNGQKQKKKFFCTVIPKIKCSFPKFSITNMKHFQRAWKNNIFDKSKVFNNKMKTSFFNFWQIWSFFGMSNFLNSYYSYSKKVFWKHPNTTAIDFTWWSFYGVRFFKFL